MKPKSGKPQVVSTQRQAEAAGPGGWKVKGATGLYLMVSATGARSGAFRYPRLDNPSKTREMGLGPLADLDAMKDKAKAAHTLRRSGKDPIEERERERAEAAKQRAAAAQQAEKPVTFADGVESFLSARAPDWRRDNAREAWLCPIKLYALPTIGALPLNDLRIEHVLAAMTKAEQTVADKDANRRRSRDGKESARRVRQRIAQVIDYAAALGFRDQNLANPAAPGPIRAIKPLKQIGERAHFRRIANLDDAPAEFCALLAAFQQRPSTPLAGLILMISCGLRPGEALNLKWANIDLNRRTLTLEPDQTKGFRKHVAPLSDLAMRAIKQQWSVHRSDYVFPANRRSRDGSMNHAFSESAFGEATKRAGLNLQTTPHAWRSVFRSWCKVHGRVPFEIAEEALAHATAPVVGAYDRDPAIEERRDVMARYAAWLTAETNVIALRKAS